MVLIINVFLASKGWFWGVTLGLQIMFYILAIVGHITKTGNKYIKLITYYVMTVIAQWHGVINIITGKAKPTWSKAESTR